MTKAVFLDRDGTLNVDKRYVYKPEDFEFTEYAPESIKMLNEAGYKVIVVSNQSGIGRGYYSERDTLILHDYIDNELKKYGACIDAYYFCPHHPGIGCDCRKPKPGLVEKAVAKFDIDTSVSWLVGDKISDVECAQKAGLRSALIGESGNKELLCFSNLHEFAVAILQNRG